MTTKGLEALTTEDELKEVKIVGRKPVTLLKRTFNQSDFKGGFIKYWRVMTPGHRFFHSDLSLEGLKEKGIV